MGAKETAVLSCLKGAAANRNARLAIVHGDLGVSVAGAVVRREVLASLRQSASHEARHGRNRVEDRTLLVNDGKNRLDDRQMSFDALEAYVKSGSEFLAVVHPFSNVVSKTCDDRDEEAAVVPRQ